MESIVLFLFLVQTLIIHGPHNLAIAQKPSNSVQIYRCRDDKNLLSDSQLQQRDAALDALSLNITVPEYTGFMTTQSKGSKADDVVNAVMLCPPNIKPAGCADCIKKTVPFLKQNCPKQKEAVGWTLLSKFDSCMVRYAGYEIPRKFDNWTSVGVWSTDATSNITNHRHVFYAVARQAKEKAGDGGARRKFASGSEAYGPQEMTLYVAVQCTPDLLKDECESCLFSAIRKVQDELGQRGRSSGRFYYPNCYVRFAHENFLPKKLGI